MEYRVIFFYEKKGVCYREKGLKRKRRRRARPGKETEPVKWEKIVFQEKRLCGEAEGEGLRVWYCGIPEYDREKEWGMETLLSLLQNCINRVSADAYYLETAFREKLSVAEPAFVPAPRRMNEFLLIHLTEKLRSIDGILYLTEKEEERQEEEREFTGERELVLPDNLLRKLHFFFYRGSKGAVEPVEELLWQEYGMPLLHIGSLREIEESGIKRLLVLDDRIGGKIREESFPRGSVYVDLWSDKEKQERLAENRKDIKYFSEYQFLVTEIDFGRDWG